MTDFKLVIEEYDKLNDRHVESKNLQILCDNLGLAFYAFILHDSDYSNDFTPKRKHYHLVVKFIEGTTAKRLISLISNFLLIPKNMISVMPSYDLIHDIRYLCHLDEKDKYKYPLVDVVTSDSRVWYDVAYNNLEEPEVEFLKPFTIDTLITIVQDCNDLFDVYSSIGLEYSKKYAYLIFSMWKEKQHKL